VGECPAGEVAVLGGCLLVNNMHFSLHPVTIVAAVVTTQNQQST